MSPEEITGRTVDTRTDMYAFDVMFYEMLRGQRPFPGNEPAQLLRHHLHDVPKPLHEGAEVPREISDIVAKCVEKRAA